MSVEQVGTVSVLLHDLLLKLLAAGQPIGGGPDIDDPEFVQPVVKLLSGGVVCLPGCCQGCAATRRDQQPGATEYGEACRIGDDVGLTDD